MLERGSTHSGSRLLIHEFRRANPYLLCVVTHAMTARHLIRCPLATKEVPGYEVAMACAPDPELDAVAAEGIGPCRAAYLPVSQIEASPWSQALLPHSYRRPPPLLLGRRRGRAGRSRPRRNDHHPIAPGRGDGGGLVAPPHRRGRDGATCRILGFRSDVVRLLHGADALVQASAWEGSPNSVLEASSAGLPIVAMGVHPKLSDMVAADCWSRRNNQWNWLEQCGNS